MTRTGYEHYYWQNDRVRLRHWEPGDAEYALGDDLDSEAMALIQEEITLPPVIRVMDEKQNPPDPNPAAPAFSIETLDGQYVGCIHFNYINERNGTFSIGLLICRDQRRKGYGKSAMKLLLEYAFNERRLHKFNGFCLDDNPASRAMMLSLGCVQEGVAREVVYMNGKYHNQLLFGLTEQEYRERNPAGRSASEIAGRD